MSLPAPPPEPFDFNREPPAQKPPRTLLWLAGFLLALAALATAVVWSFTSRPPAGTPVAIDQRALTQHGADRAAGALLVAWEDPDHLQFVRWDIERVTGCVPLAMKYDGPLGHTERDSIPKDIQHDVIGRARYRDARLKVWFGCGS